MLVLSGTLTPVGFLSFSCFYINHPAGLKRPVSLDSHKSGSKTRKTPSAFSEGVA